MGDIADDMIWQEFDEMEDISSFDDYGMSVGKRKKRSKHERPTWTSANGEVFYPEQMDTRHLANAVALCSRNAGERDPIEIYGKIYTDMWMELHKRLDQSMKPKPELPFNKKLLLCSLAFLLSACGPSCKELGGHLEQTGVITMVTFAQVGNMMVPITHVYPTYECRGKP